MQNVGIIAEFNPFHNGHKYLIDHFKQNNNIICVMSGNYVQRGDTAIFSKFDRCRAALKNGADLIIDLPTPWAMSSSQNFALGGVSILKSIGITDKIVFGSECGNISALNTVASNMRTAEFDSILKQKMSSGITYARALKLTLNDINRELSGIIDSPNNTLGIEYINAAKKLNFTVEFDTEKRFGAGHNSLEINENVSATLLRKEILNNNYDFIKNYIPSNLFDDIKKCPVSDINRLELSILSSLRSDIDSIKNIPDLSEGIENRIINAVKTSVSLSELQNKIKTKRYTLSKVRRLIISAYLKQTNEFFMTEPPYIRVLGFNKKGEKLLSEIRQKSSKPVIVRYSDIPQDNDICKNLWEFECIASDLYALSLDKPQPCCTEYQNVIKI